MTLFLFRLPLGCSRRHCFIHCQPGVEFPGRSRENLSSAMLTQLDHTIRPRLQNKTLTDSMICFGVEHPDHPIWFVGARSLTVALGSWISVMWTLLISGLVPFSIVDCLFFHTTNIPHSILRHYRKPPFVSLVTLVRKNNLTRFKEVSSYGLA